MRSVLFALTLAACGRGGDSPAPASGAPAHPPFPAVPMVGMAGVIPMPRIVTVSVPGDPAAPDIATFGSAVPASAWFAAWASEYGVGTARPSVAIMGGALPAMPSAGYTDTAMDGYVAAAIASASPAPPNPDGHTIYVLVLPVGAFFETVGTCTYYGYHTVYGVLGDGLAFVQRCGTPPFDATDLDYLTTIASHEIAEAATDTGLKGWVLSTSSTQPWTGNVWATSDGSFDAEIGDLCGRQTRVVEGAYTYQRIYSNDALPAGGDPCVPSLPLTYYNTSTPQGWYARGAGTTVAIPVTGWSSGPTEDWYLSVSTRVTSAPDPGITYALSGPKITLGDAGEHYALNSGQTQTLNVTIPSSAPSGSFISIGLLSSKLTSDGGYIPGEDFGHRWIVGVYIP